MAYQLRNRTPKPDRNTDKLVERAEGQLETKMGFAYPMQLYGSINRVCIDEGFTRAFDKANGNYCAQRVYWRRSLLCNKRRKITQT